MLIRLIINAVVFQLAWFVCIALRLPWAVPAATGALALHFLWTRPGLPEAKFVGATVAIGFVVDSALTAAGVFAFDDSWRDATGIAVDAWVCPPWLLMVWVVFATTVNVSLRPLLRRPAIAAALGAIAAPFAYTMGSVLEAVRFPHGTLVTVIVVGLVWALLLPLLAHIGRRLSPSDSRVAPNRAVASGRA